MSKVLVTESSLESIADAIRAKNGTENTYKPGEMAAAIEAIETPDLEALTATQNGTYAPSAGKNGFSGAVVNVPNSYAAGDEGKVVSNGELVAQTARASEITANGTYDTTTNDEVTVNVAAGGYPPIDAIINGTLFMYCMYGASLQTSSAYVRKFLNDYARVRYGSTKGSSSGPATIASTVGITQSMMQSIQAFTAAFPVLSSAEYYGYVYGKTSVISDLGLTLLGDFSQQGASTGNTLSDSIDNYSAVLLQGIYSKNRTSQYNTCMLYINPNLNTAYWTGMKDRNYNYDCVVTFTDATTCSLSGNRQVIIYGML